MTDHCPTCGARLKPARPEYPAAERLYIQFVGRNLYAIAGKAGLWFSNRKQHDPESELCFAKGPMGEGLFYRAVEAEERIRKAMGAMEEPKP